MKIYKLNHKSSIEIKISSFHLIDKCCKSLLLSLTILGIFSVQILAQVPNYKFINGKWFDGKGFKKQTFFSVNGFLTKKKPKRIDETIDLENKFVTPPFADSHTHSFDSPYLIEKHIADNLRDGVFYAKVLNNVRSSAITIKDKVNSPESVDVQYSHGGLTGNFSHPIEVYESIGMGFYSYEQQVANAEKIWKSRKRENDAYYIIDTFEDLENKWKMILDGNPDHIKIFLRNSEVYTQGRDFIPTKWHRSDGGVNPKLVPLIVQKAHAAGLRVSVAANSVQDYQVAVRAGADEISHLPCYQLIDESEKCDLSEEDSKLTAKNGVFISIITTEYEKERDKEIIKYDYQNLRLLKKHKVKFALGSNAYGATPLRGVIEISKLGIFTNRELLNIWCETTPKTIFPNRKIGKLKSAYEASFLVLEGNPLQDFSQVQNIEMRFKQGKILNIKSADDES